MNLGSFFRVVMLGRPGTHGRLRPEPIHRHICARGPCCLPIPASPGQAGMRCAGGCGCRPWPPRALALQCKQATAGLIQALSAPRAGPRARGALGPRAPGLGARAAASYRHLAPLPRSCPNAQMRDPGATTRGAVLRGAGRLRTLPATGCRLLLCPARCCSNAPASSAPAGMCCYVPTCPCQFAL